MSAHIDFVPDVTIVGSSLTAALIALFIGREGDQKVCLVSDSSQPFRVTQTPTFAFGMFVDALAWQVLSGSQAETIKLVRDIAGRSAVKSHDLNVATASQRGAIALEFVAQCAAMQGIESEEYSVSFLQNMTAGRVFRAVPHIDGVQFWQQFFEQECDENIRILDVRSCDISLVRNGLADISFQNTKSFRSQTIFVEEAIGTQDGEWPDDLASRGIRNTQQTRIATQQIFEKSGATYIPELGLTCSKLGNGETKFSLSGAPPKALGAVESYFDEFSQDDMEAMRNFSYFTNAKRAPFCGKIGDFRTQIFGGFEHFGAFFAPAIARHILSKSSDEESQFFKNIDAFGRSSYRFEGFELLASDGEKS